MQAILGGCRLLFGDEKAACTLIFPFGLNVYLSIAKKNSPPALNFVQAAFI